VDDKIPNCAVSTGFDVCKHRGTFDQYLLAIECIFSHISTVYAVTSSRYQEFGSQKVERRTEPKASITEQH
jgi:hypothetical protein